LENEIAQFQNIVSFLCFSVHELYFVKVISISCVHPVYMI